MNKSETRDDILYAFSVEPNHDRATLESYLRQYPELAEDLIDLSHELRLSLTIGRMDASMLPDVKAKEAWEALISCKPAGTPKKTQISLYSNLKGPALVELANKLNIPRSLVTALRDRLAEPASIPMRFISRLSAASGSSIKAIQQHLALPPVTSQALQFKSDSKPENQGQVSFRKLVDDTTMTDDQRQTLLGDWVENGQD
jgi:hypothetical protein